MITVNFVCTGNTCRSPMAEAILKAELKKRDLNKRIRVKSSGLYADAGAPVSPNTKQVLKEMGITTRHRAVQFSPDEKALVITMTAAHKMSITGNVNAVSIAELTGGRDVEDPYGKDITAYRAAAGYLKYAMEDIIAYILREETKA